MKLLAITLIVHAPDPITGQQKSTTDRFREVIGDPLFSANVTNPIDFVARSSALIGSPQQVIDKVHRYHEQLGHSVMHLHADAGGLTDAQHRASLELFQSDIAPVLRREIPDPPWPGEAVADPALAGSAI